MLSPLQHLQEWYAARCNGEWEHEFGISIETVDNPGWRIEINLKKTPYENCVFQKTDREYNQADWMHCWVSDCVFIITCSPLNLDAGVRTFVDAIIECDQREPRVG
jgi:hypothetical protein